MEEIQNNKMANISMKKLLLKMGLPMILSMVLQALYNVIDSIFVANMGEKGIIANQALTIAFPIQLLIIAIGVGTGIGINALLSKSLGEKNQEKVNSVAGNGIFLSLCIFVVFLLFGLFGSEWFISLFAGGDSEVISMGTTYLQICTSLSLGSIGYTVYERFLQSTGKTLLSTIAQISGAVTNIILDYIFIFPLNMGVAGAAWATVIGQFVSLFVAMAFHYFMNKEIKGNLKYIKPNWDIIKGIYSIGISATLMQTLLSVMMAGVNAILGTAKANPAILVGSFGIYYKIQQIALFSAFGLSNTIISILSFNYGMKDKKRIDDCIKYGIIDTIIITLVITVLFEAFARPLSSLFALAGGTSKEIIDVCSVAIRIASIGYIFMGFSVAVQGVLQSLGYALRPLLISLFRLAIFVFPVAYLFTLSGNVLNLVWWTFPIAEFLTAIISFFILKKTYKEKVEILDKNSEDLIDSNKLIITIAREHGTGGKEIGKMVAKKLGIHFYDKEEIKKFAIKNSLVNGNSSCDDLYKYFLSLDAEKESIIKQKETIEKIAEKNDCVIVGRCADSILGDKPNIIKVFLYAPMEYRIGKIQKMYGDDYENAKNNIKKSDKSRANYYEVISSKKWGQKENYNLCIDCSIGNERVAESICNYISAKKK